MANPTPTILPTKTPEVGIGTNGKQGKESEEEAAANKAKTKEDKIKDILEKKDGAKKKTPAGKKLKAAKGKNAASKKLKTFALYVRTTFWTQDKFSQE